MGEGNGLTEAVTNDGSRPYALTSWRWNTT